MTRPLVALATSADWPDLTPDDSALRSALARAGVDSEITIWTDASIEWTPFDLIVVRSCWDYHNDLPRWLGWLDSLERQGAGARLCNPPAALRWNARKTYLTELVARGVPTVPTQWLEPTDLTSWANFSAAIAAAEWDDLVCKPAVSAGALGTFRLQRATLAQSASAVTAALPLLAQRGPVLVQPFVPELVTDGEWSVLFFDGRFSHAVCKRPALGDFRVQEKHGGTTTAAAPPPMLIESSRAVLAAATIY
jgi:glutathione synthase/RimK-type ligase-like ATP-grasp enzyme